VSVTEQHSVELEQLPVGEPDFRPGAFIDRLRGDHVIRERNDVALVALDAARIGLRPSDDDIGPHSAMIGQNLPLADRPNSGLLVDYTAEALDFGRESASKAGRVDGGRVRHEERPLRVPPP